MVRVRSSPARRVALVGALVLGQAAGWWSACAHPRASEHALELRLRALDARFVAFTAERLARIEDVEPALARLEALRADWLDALADATDERDRVVALLRLAELHLDLAARVRRVPYGAGFDASARKEFDAALSRMALPLEATGQGILAQVVDRAARDGVEGRFVRRARLYQRLHRGDALDDDAIDVLRAELVATTFSAPTTLLQTGRVGQRASR